MPAPATGWRDRWLDLRDRCLASPGFRRWAAWFPLTRPIAHRRARALFDLCAGFVYSQVLLACVQLRLFDILADGPQTVDGLTARLGLPLDGTRRLLDAACALRLVGRRDGERYGLGDLGAVLRGDPAIAAMVGHHDLLYADLRDPVALLRGPAGATALARHWAYAGAARPAALAPDDVSAYTALMAASQPLIAAEVLDAYPLERHRCLLDVGGGNGTFLATAARRTPRLGLMLFDLPAVADHARAHLAEAGCADRTTIVGGDFRTDPLPRGADVISLVRIVHDHDDAAALALLRAARAALPARGTLLLAEPMSGTKGAEPIGDAYFGFYLLAMGQGRPRSAGDLREMLRAAGFARTRLVPTRTPLLTRLIVARA